MTRDDLEQYKYYLNRIKRLMGYTLDDANLSQTEALKSALLKVEFILNDIWENR